jgi:Predicted membrane protein
LMGEGTRAESGYISGFTKSGCFSQAKTYFGAAGGGASSNRMRSTIDSPNSIPAGAGGGGSGGSLEAKAGFGGGGADSYPGGFGGGGAGSFAPSSNPCGGQGIVMVEYWTTD